MITLANPVAWWAVPLLMLGAGWLAWKAYARTWVTLSAARRASLVGLRFVSLLLLVLLLMRPVVLEPPSVRRDAIVPILVDASRSMNLPDAGGRSTRIAEAGALVRDSVLPALQGEFRAEVLTFGERLAPADPGRLRAEDRRSDLSAAIDAVYERYRGQSIAGLVVVSDGGDTSAVEPGTARRADAAPLYAVGVGDTRIGKDREVLGIAAGGGALADSIVRLNAQVVSHGFGDAPFDVRILENGRLVQVRKVTPAGDGAPVRVEVTATPNRDTATVYTVEIAAASDERVAENNSRSVLIKPMGRRRRVLLAQGAPGYEHSFLARALLQDPALEIDSVVRKGRNDRGEPTFYIQAAASRTPSLTGGFPVSREALFAYDAIILANLEGDFFRRDQLALAAAFVGERGGGLLALGGRSFDRAALAGTPLEEVLPVELTGRRAEATAPADASVMRLTREGETHPIMQFGTVADESRRRWSALPALATSPALGTPRPGASVLATSGEGGADARPVIAVQRYGRGRSMVFAGEGAWRWRMLLPAADRTFDTFWRQAVRWLAEQAGDPIAVSLPAGAMPGEEAVATVTVRDAGFLPVADATIAAEVVDPDGRSAAASTALIDAAAGRYEARFRAGASGVYRLRVEGRRGDAALAAVDERFLVGGENLEMTDPRLNEDVLRRLAASTGGEYHPAADVSGLRELLVRTAPDRLPPVTRDLWHNAWTFSGLVLLLSAEWLLRRRSGLR